MYSTRRTIKAFSLAITLFVSVCILPNTAWTQETKYPVHSIDLVVGFPPGSSPDVLLRIWIKYFEKYLKVPVVANYKPGAGGVIAANATAHSKPDGYTISNQGEGFVVAFLLEEAAYSLPEDLRVIARVCRLPSMIVVKADSEWKTFEYLLNYSKKNPGMKYCHPGVRGTAFLMMENLNKYANLGWVHVPYKRTPDMITAVLGGHIPMTILTTGTAMPLVDAGKMRILFSFEQPAEFGLDPTIPHVASVFGKEAEKNFIGSTAYLVVSGKTPDKICEVLERAVESMVKNPEYQDDIKKLYFIDCFAFGKTRMREEMLERMSKMKPIFQSIGLMK